MQPKVEVRGTEKLSRKLTAMSSDVVGNGVGKALFQGGLVLERGVKTEIKNKHLILTRKYTSDITTERIAEQKAAVYTATIYAGIHEFGGTIVAKDAPFLVFPIGKGEDRRWVRVVSVRIPARPHWRPAIAGKKRDILKSINKTLVHYHKKYAAR